MKSTTGKAKTTWCARFIPMKTCVFYKYCSWRSAKTTYNATTIRINLII